MEKKILKRGFMVGLLFVIAGCFTPYETVEVTQVVQAPKLNQVIIYDKIRQWFSQYFVSGKSVVDYEDKKVGTIIGNGIAQIDSNAFVGSVDNIHYNIRIDIKDNKFRVSTKITQHTTTTNEGTFTQNYVSEGTKALAAKHVKGIVDSIEKYVTDKKTDDF